MVFVRMVGDYLAFLYLLLSYLHFFRISGFALDTSARQSDENSFSLFSLLLLSLNRIFAL